SQRRKKLQALFGLKFRQTIRNELRRFTGICLAGRSAHFLGAAIIGTSTLAAQTIVQTARSRGVNIRKSQWSTTSAWIQWTSTRIRSPNSVEKSAWQRRPCRKWATSPFVRTRRAIRLEFGKATRTQIICPKLGRLSVVFPNREDHQLSTHN